MKLEHSGASLRTHVMSIDTYSRPAPPSAILETCLTVSDLARSRAFYEELFGYPVMVAEERLCAFSLGGTQVLILFSQEEVSAPVHLPFGTIPAHGSRGASHIGFRIPADSLGDWLKRLEEKGVTIESSFAWPLGGTSIYFRDPDGHLLELLTPGVWPMY
jgi:catechol 2,3-dioxygenase-like lactoylglutathione lyase family enzyme